MPNFNSQYGTLDGVTLGGNLNFTANGYTTTIKNSLLLNAGANVALGNHSLYWSTLNTTQVLKTVSGNATITGTGSGYFIYAGYGGTGQTVTIGSGITLQGAGYIGNSSAATPGPLSST